jgi:hypothetical protein
VGSLGRRATSILEDPSWELKVQNDRFGPRSRLSVEGESTPGSCSTPRNNYSLLDASNKSDSSDSEWHNITLRSRLQHIAVVFRDVKLVVGSAVSSRIIRA